MAFTDLDLSTAVLPHGYAVYADDVIKTGGDPDFWSDWIFPGFVLDPATTYEIQFEFTDDGTYESGYSAIFISCAVGDTEADYDVTLWRPLTVLTESPVSPWTATIGPGIGDWDAAVSDGDIYLLLACSPGISISAVCWQVLGDDTVTVEVGSDISNQLRGRRRNGLASVHVSSPVGSSPPSGPVRVDKAIALPVPTMVNGRPT